MCASPSGGPKGTAEDFVEGLQSFVDEISLFDVREFTIWAKFVCGRDLIETASRRAGWIPRIPGVCASPDGGPKDTSEDFTEGLEPFVVSQHFSVLSSPCVAIFTDILICIF